MSELKLNEKTCIPCQGGVPILEPEEVKAWRKKYLQIGVLPMNLRDFFCL